MLEKKQDQDITSGKEKGQGLGNTKARVWKNTSRNQETQWDRSGTQKNSRALYVYFVRKTPMNHDNPTPYKRRRPWLPMDGCN